MQKCSMWKSETDDQTLPASMPPIEGQQVKLNIKGDIKTLLGKAYTIGI